MVAVPMDVKIAVISQSSSNTNISVKFSFAICNVSPVAKPIIAKIITSPIAINLKIDKQF